MNCSHDLPKKEKKKNSRAFENFTITFLEILTIYNANRSNFKYNGFFCEGAVLIQLLASRAKAQHKIFVNL